MADRIIVSISGASGAIYGIRALEMLRDLGFETHLILTAAANSYADELTARAADVCLKEGRPLVLVVRETPLHPGHIRLMELAAQAGAVIFPPVPSFYGRPQSLDDAITATARRARAS